MLKNVQINQGGHSTISSYQGSDHNFSSIAFTSFVGTNTLDYTQNLCLLSIVGSWENTWIIDSGASDHIWHNKALFTNLMALLRLPYLMEKT